MRLLRFTCAVVRIADVRTSLYLNGYLVMDSRLREMVTALCKFTAQGAFMPSSLLKTTSDGTPRIVDVMGATVTVDR